MWIIVLKVSRRVTGGGVKGQGREQCVTTHLLLNLALTHYLISRVISTVQGLHFFCHLKNCDKIHIT